ncbi:uridylate-specific endoribonuclease D-like [Natator depressus]|uniref:uridylate-specific endoribonuclease D-like n=1 Tax=Natator depressus TaxID=27790 RepID=UPI003EBFACBA
MENPGNAASSCKCVTESAGEGEQREVPSFYSVSDSEIKSISETLYSADVNRATSSEIVLNLQHKISSDQTSAGQDYAKQKLFSYVDEDALFSKPTFARLLALLNNYERMTGKEEVVTASERQEVDAFLDEIFKTQVMAKLSQFFLSKGIYLSENDFKADLKEMWFGLYSRSKGAAMDSSGFEHVFHVVPENFTDPRVRSESPGAMGTQGKVRSGWKKWTSYPDIMAFQYSWTGYLKSVGSFFIGSSPEFELAVYTLCYKTRPNKLCTLSLGGKSAQIQTYSWANSEYGAGKRYLASSYPNSP